MIGYCFYGIFKVQKQFVQVLACSSIPFNFVLTSVERPPMCTCRILCERFGSMVPSGVASWMRFRRLPGPYLLHRIDLELSPKEKRQTRLIERLCVR